MATTLSWLSSTLNERTYPVVLGNAVKPFVGLTALFRFGLMLDMASVVLASVAT